MEVQHCRMWGVYRDGAEADDGPIAMFWDSEAARDFVGEKFDLAVCECEVEILCWNSVKDVDRDRMYRASHLLGHGAWHERQALIASEQP